MTQFYIHFYFDTGCIQRLSSFSYEYISTCRSKAQICVQLLHTTTSLTLIVISQRKHLMSIVYKNTALVAVGDCCVGQLSVCGLIEVQGLTDS
jgi:hypothetical protein